MNDAEAVLDAVRSEDPNLEPGEFCGCHDGLTIYEGNTVQVCVACRPFAYFDWRMAGFPKLPLAAINPDR